MQDGYLTNHFLVSMPQLKDDNFNRTVTLVCQHDSNGALGVIINRFSGHTFADIFMQLDIKVSDPENAVLPIFDGGPVHQEYGLVIHSNESEKHWESTLKIGVDLSLTSSRDILEDIARNNGPKRALMTLGYAGWGPGQLENEIKANSWLCTPVEPDIVFATDIECKWTQAAELIGVDYSKLTTQVGHA